MLRGEQAHITRSGRPDYHDRGTRMGGPGRIGRISRPAAAARAGKRFRGVQRGAHRARWRRDRGEAGRRPPTPGTAHPIGSRETAVAATGARPASIMRLTPATAVPAGVRKPTSSDAPPTAPSAAAARIVTAGVSSCSRKVTPWMPAAIPTDTRTSNRPTPGHRPGNVENSRCSRHPLEPARNSDAHGPA